MGQELSSEQTHLGSQQMPGLQPPRGKHPLRGGYSGKETTQILAGCIMGASWYSTSLKTCLVTDMARSSRRKKGSRNWEASLGK